MDPAKVVHVTTNRSEFSELTAGWNLAADGRRVDAKLGA